MTVTRKFLMHYEIYATRNMSLFVTVCDLSTIRDRYECNDITLNPP